MREARNSNRFSLPFLSSGLSWNVAWTLSVCGSGLAMTFQFHGKSDLEGSPLTLGIGYATFYGSLNSTNPAQGVPAAYFPNTNCDFTEHFAENNIIINLTFCMSSLILSFAFEYLITTNW